MFSLRRSFIATAASVLVLLVAIGDADSQKASNAEPKTAAELTTAIAIAIDAKIPKTPNVPIVFESATSHGNFIDVHYRATDARLFPHNKAEGDERRLRLTNYFCFTPQYGYFEEMEWWYIKSLQRPTIATLSSSPSINQRAPL